MRVASRAGIHAVEGIEAAEKIGGKRTRTNGNAILSNRSARGVQIHDVRAVLLCGGGDRRVHPIDRLADDPCPLCRQDVQCLEPRGATERVKRGARESRDGQTVAVAQTMSTL